MSNITMTNGHRYVFANSDGTPTLISSTDHVGDTTYFKNKVVIDDTEGNGTAMLTIQNDQGDYFYGPQLKLHNTGGGDAGIWFDIGDTYDWSIGMDDGSANNFQINCYNSPSAPSATYKCIQLKPPQINTTGGDNNILMDLNPEGDATSIVGSLRVSRAGIVGTYDSYKIQRIWSLGYQYSPDWSADGGGGSDSGTWGDMYGMGYFHTNSGHSYVHGGGHQTVWTTNGTIVAGICFSTGQTRWSGQEHFFGDGSGTVDRPMGFDDADIHAALYVRSGDQSDSAIISVDGGGQGDGILYCGQSGAHGGGILYRGDGTHPSEMDNMITDNIVLFRNNSDDAHPVIYYGYSSNNGSIIGTWSTSASDKRLKENVRPITGSIDKIKAITGVHFDWNAKSVEVGLNSAEDHASGSTKNQLGVLAQDVKAVLPDAVQQAPFDKRKKVSDVPDDPYLTVDYESLIPLLIEGVKDQQTIIEDLKARIIALESK